MVHVCIHVFPVLVFQVVFMGALIGGLTWGVVCDKIGRKKVCLSLHGV